MLTHAAAAVPRLCAPPPWQQGNGKPPLIASDTSGSGALMQGLAMASAPEGHFRFYFVYFRQGSLMAERRWHRKLGFDSPPCHLALA